MEIPDSGVILAAWCFLLAAVVYGGGAFAASGTWHTSSGECDHNPSADLSSRKKYISRALCRQILRTLINNTSTPIAKTLPNKQGFIILEGNILHQKVRCFVDGGAER